MEALWFFDDGMVLHSEKVRGRVVDTLVFCAGVGQLHNLSPTLHSEKVARHFVLPRGRWSQWICVVCN